jgi:hypothetical protein
MTPRPASDNVWVGWTGRGALFVSGSIVHVVIVKE